MDLRVFKFSKLKRRKEGEVKTSQKKAKKLKENGPETKRSCHEQFEAILNVWWRNEPVIVAIIWDDL